MEPSVSATSRDFSKFAVDLGDYLEISREESLQYALLIQLLTAKANSRTGFFTQQHIEQDKMFCVNLMTKHVQPALKDRFPNDSADALLSKSEALSRFLLNFSITLVGNETLINPKWKDLLIDEIIDRAPHGDGTTLPFPPQEWTQVQLKWEQETFCKFLVRMKEFEQKEENEQSQAGVESIKSGVKLKIAQIDEKIQNPSERMYRTMKLLSVTNRAFLEAMKTLS